LTVCGLQVRRGRGRGVLQVGAQRCARAACGL